MAGVFELLIGDADPVMCQNSDQRQGLSLKGRFSAAMLNVAVVEAWRGNRSATGSLRTHHRVSGSLRSSAVKTRPLSLRGFPIIVSKNPAKTFPTQNAPLSAGTVGHFGDQPVVETLVISFQMVRVYLSKNATSLARI